MQLSTDKMIARKQDGIGWIIFDNPERRNAMSLEMWQAAGDIVDDVERDDAVRVVVMRGAGDRAFMSGADISQFKDKRRNAAERRPTAGSPTRPDGGSPRCPSR